MCESCMSLRCHSLPGPARVRRMFDVSTFSCTLLDFTICLSRPMEINDNVDCLSSQCEFAITDVNRECNLRCAICYLMTWGSGPLLCMAGYSSLQGIGISLLKYRWCYESVQNYGTKLEQNVHTIGGLICG